jgi:hypothetical protein
MYTLDWIQKCIYINLILFSDFAVLSNISNHFILDNDCRKLGGVFCFSISSPQIEYKCSQLVWQQRDSRFKFD